MNWSASEALTRIAEPYTVACSADFSEKVRSRPYCSSVETASRGEQTQRIEVSMHPEGGGSSLANTVTDGSGPGTVGVTIVRAAWTPGTAMS
jgi:hypothetical protein